MSKDKPVALVGPAPRTLEEIFRPARSSRTERAGRFARWVEYLELPRESCAAILA